MKPSLTKQSLSLLFLFCAMEIAGVIKLGLVIGAQSINNYKPATTEEMGGKNRLAAYVSTDKPIYRGGEKLYGRCVLLTADSHAVVTQPTAVTFVIIGPKGDQVASGMAATEESVAGFFWEIPPGQAGGEYQLKLSGPQAGFAPAVRKFDIRDFRTPRLKTQIKFVRDGYGPGDAVSATLEVTRAEGGVPEKAKVRISARVDGAEVHMTTGTVDASGHCTVTFKLPAAMERGEGTLAFVVEDGGTLETASKTIPILLQTVDLGIYPEGGDLVAGLVGRVYLEGKTPAGKPADLSGIIVDANDDPVTVFRTEHEGRGRVVFTPVKGMSYRLKIMKPAGISKMWELPVVRDNGTILRATQDVYAKGEPVTLQVLTTETAPLTVTLRKLEEEISFQKVPATNQTTVSLTPPSGSDGVLIATVWKNQNEPVAERLIFREPARTIQVRVAADRTRYVPGAPAKITVTTTDEHGEPVSAVVGVTVTDDSLLEMIEKREQAPRLPVMVYLESDVRELADAHVYLDPANPKASLAVDLLLGTQGWRRFALVNYAKFVEENGEQGLRALAKRSAAQAIGDLSLGGIITIGSGGAMRAAPPAPGRAMIMNGGVAKTAGAVREKKVEAIDARVMRAEFANGRFDELKSPAQSRHKLLHADQEMFFVGNGPLATVREYAHTLRPGWTAREREDFSETLYWNAGVKTDAKTGQATLAFALNDAVSSFRVKADAFQSGAVGSGTGLMESVQPFYVEPKLPLEVTMGDRILLPLGLVNGTSTALNDATLKIACAKGILSEPISPLALKAEGRVRRLVELSIGDISGETDFSVDAAAGDFTDRVTRKLRVVPRGFPVTVAKGGVLGSNGSLTFTIRIPEHRIPGSVSSDLAVYPTPMANLSKALERLLQEPNGCFEQTSSTTYPVIMAQQYFTTHQGVDEKLVARGQDLLNKGYEKLSAFECKQKGYEWFGQDPGHETLTSYGLLEFTDMARVYTVDSGMLQRTRQWVMSARDGKGGFKRERRALHTWIEDKDCSNAYITWALLTGGEPATSLRPEIETVKAAARKSENSYVIAIGANVALADKDAATAKVLLDKLAARQAKDGFVDGGTMTIVGSGGVALQVETTAYALLAWLQDHSYAANVEKSLKWLANICDGGRYGSTQATVLALRAIVAYDQAHSTPRAPGSLQLRVDGHTVGGEVKFGQETSGAITLANISEFLAPGEHTVEIRMAGGSEMPCSLSVKYNNEKPDSSEQCQVGVKVALAADTVREGKITEANVTVVNRSADEIIPSPVAIVGIPGGLEVRHDQLKELVKSGKIAAYEVLGREVVLYWRSLEPREKVELPLSLVAAIPGQYTAPASRAYLYYTDEFKAWENPLRVTITPGTN